MTHLTWHVAWAGRDKWRLAAPLGARGVASRYADGERHLAYDPPGRVVSEERRVVGLAGAVTPEARVRWDHGWSLGGQALSTTLSSWEGAGGWVERLALRRSWGGVGRMRIRLAGCRAGGPMRPARSGFCGRWRN